MDRPEPPADRDPAGADAALPSNSYGARSHAVVAFAALLLYLAGGDRMPLWDRDETRYAQAVVQMLNRGDWVVPYYLTYDQSGDPARPDPRFHKPPFVYWTQAASCLAFGRNEFALRLPNALFGVASVLLAAWVGRLLFDRAVGFWSAVVLASSPMWAIAAKVCLCDSPLTMFTLAAVGLFARQVRLGPHAGTALLFWIAIGLGLLTKGPVLLLFVGSALAGAMIFGGSAIRAAARRALCAGGAEGGAAGRLLGAAAGPLIAAVIVAAWLVPVQIRTDGGFLQVAMGTHVLHRAFEPMEGHSGPPGYYLLVVLVGFFPWSFLLPATLAAAWRELRAPSNTAGAFTAGGERQPVAAASPDSVPPAGRWVFGLLLVWAVVPWIVLEFHATKLPHYLVPAVPAAAILTAKFLAGVGSAADYWRTGAGRAMRIAVVGAFVLFAIVGLAITAAVQLQWEPHHGALDDLSPAARRAIEIWQLLSIDVPGGASLRAAIAVGFVALAAAVVLAARRLGQGRLRDGVVLLAVVPAGTVMLFATSILPAVPALDLSRTAAAAIRGRFPEGRVLLAGFEIHGAGGYNEPGLVFYLGGRARIAADPIEFRRLLDEPGPQVLAAPGEHWIEQGVIPTTSAIELRGFNYSKGRPVWLLIDKVTPPPPNRP